MADVEILAERSVANAWEFDCQVLDQRGDLHSHTLTLAWSDYNLWSGDGGDEPSRVAEAVLWFLYDRLRHGQGPAAFRPSFNAAIARRLHDDADDAIPPLIRR